MRVTATPLPIITRLDGTLARVWRARTEGGTEVLLFTIALVAPGGQAEAGYDEIDAALHAPGSARFVPANQVMEACFGPPQVM